MFGIRRGDGRWYAGTVDREAQWVEGSGRIATFDTKEKAETRSVGLLEAGIECEVVPV
jgi:hypothetical protein